MKKQSLICLKLELGKIATNDQIQSRKKYKIIGQIAVYA